MEIRTLEYRLKALHDQRDFSEKLEDIHSAVVLLQKRQEQQAAQWHFISTEQKQHCSDLASIYQQLQELLLRINTTGSNSTSGDSELKEESNGGVVTLKIELCDLLQNFKNYIKRHEEETSEKLDNMQKRMERFQQIVEDNNRRFTKQEERLVDIEERQKQLQQSITFVSTMEDVKQLRDTFSQQLQSLQENTLTLMQRHNADIDEKFINCETQRREEVMTLRRETALSIDQVVERLQKELYALRQELAAHAISTENKTSSLEEQIGRYMGETLKSHVAQTHQHVQEVHRELSSKHVRLVEDTMDAVAKISQVADGLPQKVTLLQEDVGNIYDTLQRHGDILNEQCLQGSLQGAFDEVKDWLQDLEQRVLSHGEFDEIMVKMDNKLAALKRDFIIRSPIQNATERDESIDGETDPSDSGCNGGDGDGGGLK